MTLRSNFCPVPSDTGSASRTLSPTAKKAYAASPIGASPGCNKALSDLHVVYKSVDEQYVAENFQHAMATSGEIALGDAAKLLGCWNGLAKHFVDPAEREADPTPMRRAVAFAKDIRAAKQATASFPVLVDRAVDGDPHGETVGRTGRRARVCRPDMKLAFRAAGRLSEPRRNLLHPLEDLTTRRRQFS
jgi:hypothetical protein